jgi:hypothetical protein
VGATIPAHGKAGIGIQPVDLAFDIEDGVDPFHRLQCDRRDLMGRLALADIARNIGQLEELAVRVYPACVKQAPERWKTNERR